MTLLALFEVEPIGKDGEPEANGRVYHFCSPKCRHWFAIENPSPEYRQGTSPDAIEGTVCDQCGVDLGVNA